ncbi:MAG: hypothetical protein HFH09_04405 [Bacilli bacterium]|jgi:transcriptional regulator with XRE-family HTH domain|nr:hypothetical protein [Bacilli bacterium]
MNGKLGEFIKKKVDRKVDASDKKRADIIRDFGITPQYLHDLENGKRVPSANLMKTMIMVLGLSDKEQIELYDLASESHKSKKIPADIEAYIIENDNVKRKIRKMISSMEKK